MSELPKSLINSMKTLFDILDEKRTGYIKLSELEKYWESQDRYLIENLKKIVPSSGLVSFERFCVGLKMSRAQQSQQQAVQQHHHKIPVNETSKIFQSDGKNIIPIWEQQPAPKKPPRANQQQQRPPIHSTLPHEKFSKMEIMSSLEKWQRNAATAPVQDHTIDFLEPQRTVKSGKRKDRRHTLQNSIDFNILKQLKQIEFEKDMLMQGFLKVDLARNWYLQRLKMVDDKLKSVANGNREYLTETQQERLELQKIRINEVNRSLVTLIENFDRNFPMHINLEIRNQYKGIKHP